MQDGREGLDRPPLRHAVGVGARAEPVGDPAAADGDAPVGGPLGVAVGVGAVADQLGALPPDLVPDGGRQRLGDHHRAVHRQPVAAAVRQSGGVALQAAQDDVGAHRAVRGDRPAGLDGRDLRPLVHGDAAPAHGVEEPADQRGRLHAGRVRAVHRGQRTLDPDPVVHLGAAEALLVPLAEPPGRALGEHRVQPRELWLGAGDVQDAVLDDVGVDALVPAHADHVVDRLLHRPDEPTHPVPASGGGVPVEVAGQLRGEPAAVAARGAVAGELLLQDDDAQIGLSAGQVVGGPQPGEAASDDADVGGPVAGQAPARATGMPICRYQNETPPLTVPASSRVRYSRVVTATVYHPDMGRGAPTASMRSSRTPSAVASLSDRGDCGAWRRIRRTSSRSRSPRPAARPSGPSRRSARSSSSATSAST